MSNSSTLPPESKGVEGRSASACYAHVVSYSGGLGSFWAAKRVIDREGPENVTLLAADVRMEDEDLYRFWDESEKFLGVPITKVAEGRTPWELFEDEGMMGNSRVDLCSRILKRELLDKWQRQHCLEMTSVLYIGIDWTEIHRLHAHRAAKPNWRIEAPMCDAPYWDKCKMQEELEKTGIKLPRLYSMGFPHNNCGGFCVKAGQAQFAQLLKQMPERYAFHEAKESAFREKHGDVSIMKDRRGGTLKTLSMQRFRERVEAGESFDRNDWGGCGCALAAEKFSSHNSRDTELPSRQSPSSNCSEPE